MLQAIFDLIPGGLVVDKDVLVGNQSVERKALGLHGGFIQAAGANEPFLRTGIKHKELGETLFTEQAFGRWTVASLNDSVFRDPMTVGGLHVGKSGKRRTRVMSTLLAMAVGSVGGDLAELKGRFTAATVTL